MRLRERFLGCGIVLFVLMGAKIPVVCGQGLANTATAWLNTEQRTAIDRTFAVAANSPGDAEGKAKTLLEMLHGWGKI